MSSTARPRKPAEESLISALSTIRRIGSIDGKDPTEKIAGSMVIRAACGIMEDGASYTDPSWAMTAIRKKLKDPAYRATIETYLNQSSRPEGDKSDIRELIGCIIADQHYEAYEDAPRQFIDANISRTSSEGYRGMLSAVYYSAAFEKLLKKDFDGAEKMINTSYTAAGCHKAALYEDIFFKIAQINNKARSEEGEFGQYLAATKIGCMTGGAMKIEGPILDCASHCDSFTLAMSRAKEEELLVQSSVVAIDANEDTRELIKDALLYACNTNRRLLKQAPIERPPKSSASHVTAEPFQQPQSRGRN